MTIRRRMMEVLTEQDMGARDLSRMLGIREKEVYDHLVHIERSVAARDRKLTVVPSQCMDCEYVFENRRRLKPPGRCPRCKSTRLSPPVYGIR